MSKSGIVLTKGATNGLISKYLRDGIPKVPDWRERMTWLVSGAFFRSIREAVCREVMLRVCAISDGFDRQFAMVAVGEIINGFVSLVEAAYVAQSQEQLVIMMPGGQPKLDAMRESNTAINLLSSWHQGKEIMDVTPADCPLLRSISGKLYWSAANILVEARSHRPWRLE